MALITSGYNILFRNLRHCSNCLKSCLVTPNLNLSCSIDKTGFSNSRSFATLLNVDNYLTKKNVLEAVNTDISLSPSSKIFAVVFLAGRQHKITSNDLLVINSLEVETGEQIYLNKVLLVGSENFTLIGRPLVVPETARVTATVVEHTRLKKVVVFKKKRRKNYKRTKGHRQDVTVLRINSIAVMPNLS